MLKQRRVRLEGVSKVKAVTSQTRSLVQYFPTSERQLILLSVNNLSQWYMQIASNLPPSPSRPTGQSVVWNKWHLILVLLWFAFGDCSVSFRLKKGEFIMMNTIIVAFYSSIELMKYALKDYKVFLYIFSLKKFFFYIYIFF